MDDCIGDSKAICRAVHRAIVDDGGDDGGDIHTDSCMGNVWAIIELL